MMVGASDGEEREEYRQMVDDFDRYHVGARQLAGLHFHYAGYEDGYPGYSTMGEIEDTLQNVYLEIRDMKRADQHTLMLECGGVLDATKKFCASVGGDCWVPL
jgi:hypothetical protein